MAIRALRREFDKAEYVEVFDQDKLERVLAERQTPDLLISDYSLGWTSGFEVLEAVRQAAPLCAAIMFTGTGNEEVAVGAIKAGFDDYVVKSSKQLRHLAAAARMAVARAGTRRGLEENRDLLTQELYHRLHNNLQLVISLIAFTARGLQDRDAKRKLEDLGRRVQALSPCRSGCIGGGISGASSSALSCGNSSTTWSACIRSRWKGPFQVEDAAVPVDAAVPLALIANELITNALKHAFAGSGGQLAILFRSTDDGRYFLGVDDDGPGPADAVDGMGTRLVQRLAQQLAGTVEITHQAGGGTACRVTVAAERGG